MADQTDEPRGELPVFQAAEPAHPAVAANTRTASAKIGLWDNPSERCPFCAEEISVTKQLRTTVPCSTVGCQGNYHFQCLAHSPWMRAVDRAEKQLSSSVCPKCFVSAVAKTLEKKRGSALAAQTRARVPETLYSMKRKVLELCDMIPASQGGVIAAISARVMSDSAEFTERVNILYPSVSGPFLVDKHVRFEELRKLGYTLPMMCRDFAALSPKVLMGMEFSSERDFPAVLEHGKYFADNCGMTPMVLRKVRFTVKHLKAAAPTAEQMLALGLNLAELLFFGFDKQDFAQFPKVSQNDWIEKLGMNADVFALLNVKPSDFNQGAPLASFSAEALLDAYNLKDDVSRCVKLGLLAVERPARAAARSPDHSKTLITWKTEN